MAELLLKKVSNADNVSRTTYDIPILASRIVRYPSFTYPGMGGGGEKGGEAVVKQPN